MKTILVATDYSKAAANATNYAAALAHDIGAKLILFNAFQISVHTANSLIPATGIDDLLNANKAKLRKLADTISSSYKIEVDTLSKFSYVSEELKDHVENLNADMVVMGMRSKGVDGFFGSTTTQVISNARFPVLVVPEKVSYKGIGRILFACDYNCLMPDNNLPLLKDLALQLHAEVEVLQVNKINAPEEVMATAKMVKAAALEHILEGVDHVYCDVSDDHILAGIERGVEGYKADLLVMVHKHTGFWNDILDRSETKKMAIKTKVPLLSIPYQSR